MHSYNIHNIVDWKPFFSSRLWNLLSSKLNSLNWGFRQFPTPVLYGVCSYWRTHRRSLTNQVIVQIRVYNLDTRINLELFACSGIAYMLYTRAPCLWCDVFIELCFSLHVLDINTLWNKTTNRRGNEAYPISKWPVWDFNSVYWEPPFVLYWCKCYCFYWNVDWK